MSNRNLFYFFEQTSIYILSFWWIWFDIDIISLNPDVEIMIFLCLIEVIDLLCWQSCYKKCRFLKTNPAFSMQNLNLLRYPFHAQSDFEHYVNKLLRCNILEFSIIFSIAFDWYNDCDCFVLSKSIFNVLILILSSYYCSFWRVSLLSY